MSVAELEPTTQGELALIVQANPIVLLRDPKEFASWYQRVKAELGAIVPDVSTSKGRKEVASWAFKVTKSKTFLEGHGKLLKEDAQKTVNTVNASLRTVREELDALAAEIRSPLTEWEAQEADRQKRCDGTMARLMAAGVVSLDDTVETVRGRLDEIAPMVFEDADWQERAAGARVAQESAVSALTAALERLENEARERAQAEADRAELAALREAKAEQERLQAEREAEQARQAAEREAAAQEAAKKAEEAAEAARQAELAAERAAQAERDRAAAIEAAAERARAEAKRAAEKAVADAAAKVERDRIAAEQAQEAERRKVAQAHADELAKIKREADAERERAEAAERRRVAEQEAAAAEQKRKDEDIAHKSAVLTALKDSLVTHAKISEDDARTVLLVIKGGMLAPHISLKF